MRHASNPLLRAFRHRCADRGCPNGPDLTGVELVAAVCRAGGFGILQAQLDPPAHLREEIRRLRALTSSPFGVNFVLHFPHEDGIRVCIEERVAALSLFWGRAVQRSQLSPICNSFQVLDATGVADDSAGRKSLNLCEATESMGGRL